MDNSWAHQRLDEIRTLMERAAIYRRALGPVMVTLGVLGIGASLFARFLNLNTPEMFGAYWLSISLLALAAAFLLVRRQSLSANEPFWSPPTRRVAQALIPALAAGAVLAVHLFLGGATPLKSPGVIIPLWMFFYGCAVHAAGFFMTRGIKLFGWLFIIGSIGLQIALGEDLAALEVRTGHLLMGVFFGGFHLAYGIYLQFTERRSASA